VYYVIFYSKNKKSAACYDFLSFSDSTNKAALLKIEALTSLFCGAAGLEPAFP
jgi:hypothetical protein